MNELVKKLSEKFSPIEANRPETSSKALLERIELEYVHILFKDTGTEIGMQLDLPNCDISTGDFENGTGKIHLEGALTLNYDRVRCIADIDLKKLNGIGKLQVIDNEEEYKSIVKLAE